MASCHRIDLKAAGLRTGIAPVEADYSEEVDNFVGRIGLADLEDLDCNCLDLADLVEHSDPVQESTIDHNRLVGSPVSQKGVGRQSNLAADHTMAAGMMFAGCHALVCSARSSRWVSHIVPAGELWLLTSTEVRHLVRTEMDHCLSHTVRGAD